MRANLILLLSMVALCITQASYADEKIIVVPAVLDPSAPIAVSVQAECSVETSVGNQIFQNVQERIPGAVQSLNPGQVEPTSIVLKVTILSVRGVGGGGWSGSKSIAIRADLLQNTQVIGTKTLTRNSRGGVWGGVSGTCAIMDRIAAALGRDVAGWLPGALVITRQKASSPDPSTAQAVKEDEGGSSASGKAASDFKQ